MKILKTVIVSIVTICVLASMTLCFGACGNEGKDNSQVETTVVATTVAPTTIASTTVASTTVKPTEKATEPTTTKAIKVEATGNEKDEKDENNGNEDSEDESQSRVDSSADNGDVGTDNDYVGSSGINYNAQYSPDEFQNSGVINWGGYQWTYYSELILPGDGLNIPGRHTTSDGYVCDGDGYVVLAADLSMLPRYSVVDTPFGYTGKVYDTGCAYGILDVYVGW